MARILSIDFGLKRTGIAVSDPLQMIANPLDTIESVQLIEFLKKYFSKENVECIVIGDPINLDTSASEMSMKVDELLALLKKDFPLIKFVKLDERFTSKIASRTIGKMHLSKKKRKDKGLIDKVSAVILLQNYLDSIKK